MQIAQARPHLPALTGLRFVAAMHVVLFHTAMPYLAGAPGWLRGFVGNGFVGVSLFFVLSGFILAYNYLDGEGENEGRVRARPFWAARFARVYPVYLLGLLLALPFFALEMAKRSGEVLAWFGAAVVAVPGLVQAWLPHTTLVWNGPGWSLSAEAFFYLVFPLLAVPVTRLGRRGLAVLFVAAWALTFVAPLLYWLADPDRLGVGAHQYITPWLNVVKFNPVVRFPEFLMGVALGRAYVLHRRGGAVPGRINGVIALAVSAGIVATLCLGDRLPYVFLHNGLLAPAFAALVWTLAAGRGVLGKAFAGPTLGLLGESSYALYVLHLPLSTLLLSAWKAAGLGAGSPQYLALYLVFSVALSVVVLRRVEEPARRALRRRLSSRHEARTAVPTPEPSVVAA